MGVTLCAWGILMVTFLVGEAMGLPFGLTSVLSIAEGLTLNLPSSQSWPNATFSPRHATSEYAAGMIASMGMPRRAYYWCTRRCKNSWLRARWEALLDRRGSGG